MEIKLVAIDVDGTLITDDGKVSLRTKQVLQALREQGVKIIISTGRGPSECQPIIDELYLNDYVISHNGALIFDPQNKQVFSELGFYVKDIYPLLRYLDKLQVCYIVNTPFDLYVNRQEEAEQSIYSHRIERNVVHDFLHINEKVVKLSINGAEDDIEQVYKDIKPLFSEWAITRRGETTINVMHLLASKGNGLQQLVNHYQLSSDQVLAFGNYFNDIEMIQMAGIGVAVENAPKEVQLVADEITSSNNKDGVAKYLEKVLSSSGNFSSRRKEA